MEERRLRTSRARWAVAAFALVALAGRGANAGDVARARKLFADGVRLYQTGDYEGAKRLFKEADAEHHAPAIVYNVGLAEEKLGHRQAALDAYEAYVAEVGDRGELSSAAVAAIAQIRASSTKLRIESKPPGARVFLDGMPLAETTPTTYLVGGGHHVIVAQGEGWRAERDLEASGGGETLTVALEEPPRVAAVPSSPAVPAPEAAVVPAAPEPNNVDKRSPEPPAAPDGLVWGASFAIVPAVMFGVPQDERGTKTNTNDIATILAGPFIEVGYALTPSFEFLGRGLVGIGPDAKPASTMYMGGPGLSFRVAERLWLGATFIGGRIDSARKGVPYGTNLVFGAIAEVTFAVIRKPHGEWVVGVQPSVLLTEMRNDNTTFFVPLSFGYRSY